MNSIDKFGPEAEQSPTVVRGVGAIPAQYIFFFLYLCIRIVCSYVCKHTQATGFMPSIRQRLFKIEKKKV